MSTSPTQRPRRSTAADTGKPERTDARPHLGTVLRFTPGAARSGVQRLQGGGFQVASSGDFRSAAAVPNDFDGADVQYFERFGIAIVRRDPERLSAVLQAAMADRVVSASRPELQYRALHAVSTQDYLHGYRDGVNELVNRLTEAGGAAQAQAQGWDETRLTWGLQAINLSSATAATGAGVRVAVLDTGFHHTHADFAGRAISKRLFASHSAFDDVDGHGTHCIGTACGPRAPVGVPRYGVACEAEIYAGKVLGDDGRGTDRSVIAGMEWALEAGCAVISMSLGADVARGARPSDDYEQIGRICLDAGTLVVAAAGNASARPGRIEPVNSPANASTIMAVAALDQALEPADFSCGGVNPGQEVDIAAPGVDVLSAWTGGGHRRLPGTSMATPHVAGVAALLAQTDAGLRGWALWARLLQLVRSLDARSRDVGRGLLQAP